MGIQYGKLAAESGEKLELQVMKSASGYYIGTCTEMGPFSRESEEYFRTSNTASKALENGTWTQRMNP